MAAKPEFVFTKILTVTDVKKSLAVPSSILHLFPPFINGGHKVTFPVVSGTSRWTIDCTTRRMGSYKKPVLSGKPWLRFATANKLQVGDRFTLYRVKDQGRPYYYRVEVGHQGLLRQPTTPYGAELALTLAPPNVEREIHFIGIPDGGANAMGHQGLLRQPTTPYGAELALTLAPPNVE
ncbi:hypothetical protein V6Z12_D04G210800 [Gossypium hirsutum]